MARTPKFIDAYHFGPPIQARGLGSLNDLALHHVDLQERLDLRSDLLLHRGLRAGLLEDDQDVDEDDPIAAMDVVDEHVRLRVPGRLLEGHLAREPVPPFPDEHVRLPYPEGEARGQREPHRFRGHDLVAVAPVPDPSEFCEDLVQDLRPAEGDAVCDRMDEVVVVPEAHDHGVLEARPQVFKGHQALRTRSRAASPARSRMSVSPFTWPSRVRTTPSQIVVSTTPPCAE